MGVYILLSHRSWFGVIFHCPCLQPTSHSASCIPCRYMFLLCRSLSLGGFGCPPTHPLARAPPDHHPESPTPPLPTLALFPCLSPDSDDSTGSPPALLLKKPGGSAVLAVGTQVVQLSIQNPLAEGRRRQAGTDPTNCHSQGIAPQFRYCDSSCDFRRR
jgi:hypothetical protein